MKLLSGSGGNSRTHSRNVRPADSHSASACDQQQDPASRYVFIGILAKNDDDVLLREFTTISKPPLSWGRAGNPLGETYSAWQPADGAYSGIHRRLSGIPGNRGSPPSKFPALVLLIAHAKYKLPSRSINGTEFCQSTTTASNRCPSNRVPGARQHFHTTPRQAALYFEPEGIRSSFGGACIAFL